MRRRLGHADGEALRPLLGGFAGPAMGGVGGALSASLPLSGPVSERRWTLRVTAPGSVTPGDPVAPERGDGGGPDQQLQ